MGTLELWKYALTVNLFCRAQKHLHKIESKGKKGSERQIEREREREKCDEIGSTSVHTRSLFQLLMFQAPAPSGSPEKSKIEETEEDEHNNDDDQVFRVGRLEV